MAFRIVSEGRPAAAPTSRFRVVSGGAFGLDKVETIGAPRPMSFRELAPLSTALHRASPALTFSPLGALAGGLDLASGLSNVGAGLSENVGRMASGQRPLPLQSA